MDSRWYFVLGDLASNVLVGAIAGWLCAMAVVTGWPMLPAMLLAMAIGMLTGLLLWFPLGIAFGAMEVMVATMFSGMVSGMLLGMWAAMTPLPAHIALATGGLCGLVCIGVIWVLNSRLRGVQGLV